MPDTPSEDDKPPSTGSPRTGQRHKRGFSLFGFGRAGRSDSAAEQPAGPDANPTDMAMVLRVREFANLRVGDVMVQRSDVAAVEVSCTFHELIQAFAENAVSRLPVYRETLDEPIGFVHIKDIIARLASGEYSDDDRVVETLRRDLLFVPPSMRCADLLVKMQAKRMHLALVVDEYGGTDGLVTLEDLVETIVGDIEDEHDEDDAPDIHNRGRGVWDADARVEIEDFTEASGFDLSLPDFEDDIESLGGLAFAIAGRVPQRGEVLKHPAGVDFEIVDADDRRIRRLRLRLPSPSLTPTQPANGSRS